MREWALGLVCCAVCLMPMFILASELDGDEFIKGGAGALAVATVLAIREVVSKFGKRV